MNHFHIAIALGLAFLGLGYGTHVKAQGSVPPSAGFVVPEWKSADGAIVLRLRARALHDFYNVAMDFDDASRDNDLTDDNLRSLRIGVDGQLSPKIRIRADANLINSQINWSDVYLGYVDDKIEVFVGQNYLSAPLEFVSRTVNSVLPERSLVNLAFGQNPRNFGAVARVKGHDWQVVGGVYHGNLNAGDIFGDDVLRSAQIRATYAPLNAGRDVVHVGVNVRVRDAQDGPLLRYATRPAATSFAPRALDSGAVAKSDTTLGFELAMMRGPIVITSEIEFVWADTAMGSIELRGTYVEAAWWLTGESRRYQAGAGSLTPVQPRRSVQEGGIGAVAFAVRYDHVDQTDRGLGASAGRVNALSLGVSWMPIDFVTFRLATSHNRYSGPNPSSTGTARVMMARAQFAF